MATTKKRPKKTAKKKRPKTVLMKVAHVEALDECANVLEEVLEGPLTPELVEAAEEALETLGTFDEPEESEED
jgi:hypothetical protein